MNTRAAILTSIAVVAVTLLVAVGAATLLRGPEATTGNQSAAPVSSPSSAPVTGRPDCPADGVGPVSLPCLGGNAGGSGQGGIVLANVWAWWCGPCRDELVHVQEYAQAHPEVTVVGVHADENPANGAAFLTDLGIDLPSYQDSDNTFAGTLGLPGVVPVTVLFVDGEQVDFYPRVFHSAGDIEDAVAESLSEAA